MGLYMKNPLQDPMRNVGLSAQFMKYEQDREKENAHISDRQKKLAYVGMGISGAFIIAVVALFFIM